MADEPGLTMSAGPRARPPLPGARPSQHRFLNGEVHDWYRITLGYSDQVVIQLMEKLGISDSSRILDPFCGTGTTLVECMKRGVEAVGVDANPASLFAAKVKTDWSLRSGHLLDLLDDVEGSLGKYMRRRSIYRRDPTYQYLESSGMLKRGWISEEPLRKSLALKACIRATPSSAPYRNALMLAIVTEFVRSASNVKFGPELYCGAAKDDVDVISGFRERVESMAADLDVVSEVKAPASLLIEGDSRTLCGLLRSNRVGTFDAIVSSPPYPTEHDYTRNGRLELAFLERVTDLESLRACKKRMIRSHTKGIYKGDRDASLVSDDAEIRTLAREIDSRTKGKTHGFARFYSTVIKEYFGGMKRHLRSTRGVLRPGARCAYVVGDQSCYSSVHIPTAAILARLATGLGFKAWIEQWRVRRSTTTAAEIRENILHLENPDRRT